MNIKVNNKSIFFMLMLVDDCDFYVSAKIKSFRIMGFLPKGRNDKTVRKLIALYTILHEHF